MYLSFIRRKYINFQNGEKFTLPPIVYNVLKIRGGGRVSWDKVREWHGHIYTTKCKIDS